VTERIQKLKEFFVDTWSELKKTTWPGKPEVYGTTLVVIVTVLICAFYLWIVDLILNKGMEAIFRVFGT
jgi:preprotein translocase subunit SecE